MPTLTVTLFILLFTVSVGQHNIDDVLISGKSPRGARSRRHRPTCPQQCVCVDGSAYCDAINLRSVPRHLHPDTRFIYMRNNYIRRISYRRFRNLYLLKHLLLKGNRIIEIEHNAFQDATNLISLSLTDNKLSYLPPDVFYSMFNLKVLSIRHNRLRRIDGLFDGLHALQLINLASNRIKSINERTFKDTVQLRVLDLHSNSLTYVAPNALINIPVLKYVVLRDNPLAHVTVHFHPAVQLQLLDVSNCQLIDVVKGLPQIIDDLRLNNNKITELKPDDFKKTKKIRLLVLNNNELSFVHEKALSGLQELYDLYVGKNQLTEVPVVPTNVHAIYANYNNISHILEGTFQFKTRLEFIFLRYNQIQKIEETAFHGLRFTRSLDLSRNKIMELKRYTFQYMSRLELLDLTKNPLEELEYGCFHGLRSLSILQMSSVATKSLIIPSTFRDLRQVLFLDLSNSSTLVHNLALTSFSLSPFASVQDLNLMDDHLESLPSDFPKFFPHLRVIKLVGNPWHCNRTILWLVDWIRNSTVEFYASHYMKCASPPELEGRALQSLQPTELTYEPQSQNRINLEDYNVIWEIIDNKNNDGTLTPGKLNLDIYPKRGTEIAGLQEGSRRGVAYGKKNQQTNRNPYGQIVTEDTYESETIKIHDNKHQNSVVKEEQVDNTDDRFSPERLQELREGTTLKEVQRTVESFNLFDDSSGFVSSEEFLIV